MKRKLSLLGVDFGASGGRAMQGLFDGSRLEMSEVYRFANEPVRLGRHLYWDFLRLFHELKTGIARFCRESGEHEPVSLAIDTWGVDIGFIDNTGSLMANPFHYRDVRNEFAMKEVFGKFPRDELYQTTGTYPWQYNTIFQMYATKLQHPSLLDGAESAMFMSDLFNFFLTGVKATEYTIASTSGLMDPKQRTWSADVFDRLGLPKHLFAAPVQPGTPLAPLTQDIRDEYGLPQLSVVASVSHDTAAAIASIPATQADYAYISCGTLSIMGVETEHPVVTPQSLQYAFTNEGGLEHRTRLLKNIMGLWLLQECRKQWGKQGESLDYGEMQKMAKAEPGMLNFVDPEDGSFLAPDDMPAAIAAYCRRTGQPTPQSKAAMIRCVVDSLALKHRQTLDELELLLNKRIGIIHIVGGGVQHELLCQLTANATGRPVMAGPVESASIGNLLVQALACGELGSVAEMREVVIRSFSPTLYQPTDTSRWEQAYENYKQLICLQDKEMES
ncbi:MAG: rhamnulokinase [Paenibacillaceae bacterium]|jgi:rhamnulokinase|nr:rhamnulokinase [Paenibacillaceae bacterium]